MGELYSYVYEHDNGPETSEVLRGWGERGGDEDDVFIEFAQARSGARAIALPKGGVHKLAQIAAQVLPRDQRHKLIANLVSIMKEALPRGTNQGLLAFAVNDWALGLAESEIVTLSLGLGPGAGSLTFRFETKDARELGPVSA